MHAQDENLRKNRGRIATHTTIQKKRIETKGIELLDNRNVMVTQRKVTKNESNPQNNRALVFSGVTDNNGNEHIVLPSNIVDAGKKEPQHPQKLHDAERNALGEIYSILDSHSKNVGTPIKSTYGWAVLRVSAAPCKLCKQAIAEMNSELPNIGITVKYSGDKTHKKSEAFPGLTHGYDGKGVHSHDNIHLYMSNDALLGDGQSEFDRLFKIFINVKFQSKVVLLLASIAKDSKGTAKSAVEWVDGLNRQGLMLNEKIDLTDDKRKSIREEIELKIASLEGYSKSVVGAIPSAPSKQVVVNYEGNVNASEL